MEAVSPAAKPSSINPPAISRTAAPVSFQLQLCQMPSCFCRIHTCEPRFSTPFQNMAGSVSPSSTTWVLG
jgi:hypothetical protein